MIQRSRGSYDEFQVTVGQYARLSIALNPLEIEQICERGKLFLQTVILDAIEVLINYFGIRTSASSVMWKAAHLKELVIFARSHIPSRPQNVVDKSSDLLAHNLSSVFNSKKNYLHLLHLKEGLWMHEWRLVQ